ncbi:hypothetical protein FRC04_001910 [Tulasnella sp. 424]|nr:hypothetical protein FRC04_001910 [Tulasnella sp. 424]KAG8977688.1 hypothetical protein FRC05_000944 [Tulasnella sp. 425]
MAAPARAYAVPPPEFGRDGGEFYRHYDKIADQLDNGIVKGLKASLDGLLIFAGLFAAINSSFLALTLPQMSANPVDDTNALLLELVRRNGTSPVDLPVDLPSKTFSPKPHIPLVNHLLMISLASALIAAFFAVSGKQWLANYQTLDGSGGEKQRGAQLKRSRSAERWGLVPFLDVAIPLLLQFALVIFAVGIIIYLVRLDHALGYTIVGLASLATIFAVYALFVSLWDPYSPYVTPVSRFLKWSGPAILLFVIWVVVMIARLVKSLTAVAFAIAGDQHESGIVVARRTRHTIKGIFPRYREGDMPVHFQADFVGRI